MVKTKTPASRGRSDQNCPIPYGFFEDKSSRDVCEV